MIKKLLLTLMTSLVITGVTSAMKPEDKYPLDLEEMSFSEGVTYMAPWELEETLECPLCLQMRSFPSKEFLLKALKNLTDKQRKELILTITDYTGDFIPGSWCQICGENLPQ